MSENLLTETHQLKNTPSAEDDSAEGQLRAADRHLELEGPNSFDSIANRNRKFGFRYDGNFIVHQKSKISSVLSFMSCEKDSPRLFSQLSDLNFVIENKVSEWASGKLENMDFAPRFCSNVRSLQADY